MPYFELSHDDVSFPPAYFADINGLIAVGGDITPERLLQAYTCGIYFWHHPFDPISWWSPDPRIVLELDSFDFPEDRFQRLQDQFKVTYNADFENTIRLCQQVLNKKDEMTNEYLYELAARAFLTLHQQGLAHSLEVWKNKQLVGGIFGVAIGQHFFGEYLGATVPDADEMAVLSLIKRLKEADFELIDMQKPTVFFEGLTYDELSRLSYVDRCKSNGEQYAINL